MLERVLGLHPAWSYPDPPNVAFLGVSRWSGSAGLMLTTADASVAPVEVAVDVGVHVSEVRARLHESGLEVVDGPTDRPWFRCDLMFVLPEGHRIRVSGPSTPEPEGR